MYSMHFNNEKVLTCTIMTFFEIRFDSMSSKVNIHHLVIDNLPRRSDKTDNLSAIEHMHDLTFCAKLTFHIDKESVCRFKPCLDRLNLTRFLFNTKSQYWTNKLVFTCHHSHRHHSWPKTE